MGFAGVPKTAKMTGPLPINQSTSQSQQASEVPSKVPLDFNIYRLPMCILTTSVRITVKLIHLQGWYHFSSCFQNHQGHWLWNLFYKAKKHEATSNRNENSSLKIRWRILASGLRNNNPCRRIIKTHSYEIRQHSSTRITMYIFVLKETILMSISKSS